MLQAAMRRSAHSLAPKVEAVVVAQRSYAGMEGIKGYDGKEQAEEAVFFHKEDEKILKKLLLKVRASAEVNDKHAAAGARASELSSLESIVGSKLTEADKEALLKWKHDH